MTDAKTLAALRVRVEGRDVTLLDVACRAGWNHRRSKWTQPEWDRLPLATRLVIADKFVVATTALLRALEESAAPDAQAREGR